MRIPEKNVLEDIHNAADIFSMPDDQLYSLIAGGALSPVVNQDTVKNANLDRCSRGSMLSEHFVCLSIYSGQWLFPLL